MILKKPHNLACPLDDAPLVGFGKQLVCAKGHSFDIARQGYANLLPVQYKRSKDPGDSKEMINARKRILDSGLFKPVATALSALGLRHLPQSASLCVMDAGCGEGYYLNHFCNQTLAQSCQGEITLIGLDISKWAILAATKRNPRISWIVGSNKRPPTQHASLDLIFSTFGFPDYKGFKKVLRAGAKIILTEAGPDHLMELREIIYPNVKRDGPPDLAQAQAQGFELIDTQALNYSSAPLQQTQLQDLLTMTPHMYRATQQGKDAAQQLDTLALTIDIVFRTVQLS